MKSFKWLPKNSCNVSKGLCCCYSFTQAGITNMCAQPGKLWVTEYLRLGVDWRGLGEEKSSELPQITNPPWWCHSQKWLLFPIHWVLCSSAKIPSCFAFREVGGMGKDMQYWPNPVHFSLEAAPSSCLWPPAPTGISQSWVRSGDCTIPLFFFQPTMGCKQKDFKIPCEMNSILWLKMFQVYSFPFHFRNYIINKSWNLISRYKKKLNLKVATWVQNFNSASS